MNRVSRLLWPYLRRHRRVLLLACAAMVGEVVTALLTPWPLKVVVDNVIFVAGPNGRRTLRTHLDGHTITILVGASIAALLIAGFDAAFTYADDRVTSIVAQRSVNDLRLNVFAHLQRLSLAFHLHRDTRVGDLLSRLSGDIQSLQDLASDGISNLITNGLTLFAMIIVMAWLDVRLALVALVATIPLFILARATTLRMRSALRVARRHEGRVSATLQESLTSVKLVQAYAREDYEHQKVAAESSKSLAAGIEAAELQARLNPLITVLSAIGTVSVTAYGVVLSVNRSITPGDLLVFLGYLRAMQSPVRQLAKLSYGIGKAVAGAERLDETLNVTVAVAELPDAKKMPRPRGAIRFDHVTFGYAQPTPTGPRPPHEGIDPRESASEPVLRDISLDIPAGSVVAVVGPTGAGKTTLVSLLPRFYDPSAGRVCIDGIDIREVTLQSLRSQIGLVLQDALIFNASIRTNIAYGRPDATDAEIEAAARAAGVDVIARRLENGYDTVVSERGASLSGGEKQCIGIARAILKDAPILLLDEPTSSMDAHTEQLVLQGLRRLTRDRTVLMIAHRLATVREADLVVVVRDGVIAETGRPDELLRSDDSIFASLARTQSLAVAGPSTVGRAGSWRPGRPVPRSSAGGTGWSRS